VTNQIPEDSPVFTGEITAEILSARRDLRGLLQRERRAAGADLEEWDRRLDDAYDAYDAEQEE
jgi:hypothetical protein